MKRSMAITICALLLVIPATGRAQTESRYKSYGEGYVFFAFRNAQQGKGAAGAGGELFIYRGLAAGVDAGTTVTSPDNRITIGSIGISYHFLRSRTEPKVEPFFGAGFTSLNGNINTHGYTYPFGPGQDRTGHYFSQGLITWPTKHLGIRFELREYRLFVSYGALENVIPGGNPVEFRIGVVLR